MSEALDVKQVRAILLSDNEETRQRFLQHFGSEIRNFVSEVTRTYSRLQEMPARVPHDIRSGWVEQYLFVAFNSLVTSFHLFISGFHIPAGNLMRHYGEATAIALLLSHGQLNSFHALVRDRRFRYRMHYTSY
jgi:hypothetical protein